jgi:hypothetical protein
MKKILFLAICLIGITSATFAQNDDRTPSIGAGFSFGGNVGTHSSDIPVASGVNLTFEYPISDTQFSVLVKTGFTFYVSANGYSTGYDTYDGGYSDGTLVSFAPLQVGTKYYVTDRIFVEGDAGVSFNLNSGSDYTSKKVAPLVSPSAGYTLPFGSTRFSVDMSIGYEDRIAPSDDYYQYQQIYFKATFNLGL